MNILCCGRMKEGKTSYALYLAHEWGGGSVAWDPRHMIDDEMAGHARYTSVEYVGEPEELEQAVEDYQDDQDTDRLIVYRPTSLDSEADFEALCSVLFDPPERFQHWALVVDEAAQLQTSHSISDHLSRAVRQHPRSVLIIQTTHSLQDWHRASKDLTNHLFCFRLVGRSLRAVIEFCDGSEEMEETIKNLAPHTCIHISFESQRGAAEYETIQPEIWYQ